jgi:hypothetical protein
MDEMREVLRQAQAAAVQATDAGDWPAREAAEETQMRLLRQRSHVKPVVLRRSEGSSK